MSATDGPLYRLLPDGPVLTESELTANRIESDLADALGIPVSAVAVEGRVFAAGALHLTVFLMAPVVES